MRAVANAAVRLSASMTVTEIPARASECAMPAPIVPPPITTAARMLRDSPGASARAAFLAPTRRKNNLMRFLPASVLRSSMSAQRSASDAAAWSCVYESSTVSTRRIAAGRLSPDRWRVMLRNRSHTMPRSPASLSRPAIGGTAAGRRCVAHDCATVKSISRDTTRSSKPTVSASAGESDLPVTMIFNASPRPTSLGSRIMPPQLGTRPRVDSGSPI